MINALLPDLSAIVMCATVCRCGFGSAASIQTHSTERQIGSVYSTACWTWRHTKRVVDALFDARLAKARERIARIYPANECSFPGHLFQATSDRRSHAIRAATSRWPLGPILQPTAPTRTASHYWKSRVRTQHTGIRCLPQPLLWRWTAVDRRL